MTSCPRLPGTRRRSLALLATAAFAGALVPLAGSPATAALSTEAVTFTADCGLFGLGGTSAVDRDELTVTAGSRVEFVNQAGRPMTLRWDGERVVVAAGDSHALELADGPADLTVSLRVRCLLDSPTSRVTVTVTEPEPSPTNPAPIDDDRAADAGDSEPAPSPSAVGGAYGEAAEPDGSARPGGWTPGDATDVDEPEPLPGALPDDGAMSDRPEPVGDDGAEGDAGAGPVGEPTPDDADLAPAASSAPDDGSVGLLALIATVCVVGVSAGAIRVLLGQRAVRDPA